jgi:hypothetical protein
MQMRGNMELPDAETLRQLYSSQPAVEWGREWVSRVSNSTNGNVRKITDRLVAKIGSQPKNEARAIKLVTAKTNIPVPRSHISEYSLLILDFIDGQTISQCWNNLTFFMQLRIACTIRTYITQLRQIRGSKPGPLEGPIHGGLFECEEINHSFDTWIRL